MTAACERILDYDTARIWSFVTFSGVCAASANGVRRVGGGVVATHGALDPVDVVRDPREDAGQTAGVLTTRVRRHARLQPPVAVLAHQRAARVARTDAHVSPALASARELGAEARSGRIVSPGAQTRRADFVEEAVFRRQDRQLSGPRAALGRTT